MLTVYLVGMASWFSRAAVPTPAATTATPAAPSSGIPPYPSPPPPSITGEYIKAFALSTLSSPKGVKCVSVNGRAVVFYRRPAVHHQSFDTSSFVSSY
jgi:hypothetical protein